MLEIIVSLLTLALFFYAVKLSLKVTWGLAKIIAVILFVVALPLLVVLIMSAGGLLLLLPLVLIVGAILLLVKCAA